VFEGIATEAQAGLDGAPPLGQHPRP
jgi:hypothetical protein